MNTKEKDFSYLKCSESHPPLKIGDYQIWGGSCVSPAAHLGEFDIYVGFDRGMEDNYLHYPWHQGESFLFYIPDMGVPKDLKEFKNLIGWLEVQLKLGKRIHLGCIGGHGRTGMVLAALVKKMLKEEDAITFVRKGYCDKAVETQEQVNWLHKHFGIKQVQAHSKSKFGGYFPKTGGKKVDDPDTLVIRPIRSSLSVFGVGAKNMKII